MEEPGLTRTFIAIPVTDSLNPLIDPFKSEIYDNNINLRWIEPHNLHLTVRFLGSITPQMVDKVSVIVTSLKSVKPFKLILKSIGSFDINNPRSVRIIAQSSPSPDTLSMLYKDISSKLRQIGIPEKQQPFTPHITIARVPSDIDTGSIKKLSFILSHRTENVASLDVSARKITVFKSTPTPQGSVYIPIVEKYIK